MILLSRSAKSRSPLQKYLLKDLSSLFKHSVLENRCSANNLYETADLYECNSVIFVGHRELAVANINTNNTNNKSNKNNNKLKFKVLKVDTFESLKNVVNVSKESKMTLHTEGVPENVRSVFEQLVADSNTSNSDSNTNNSETDVNKAEKDGNKAETGGNKADMSRKVDKILSLIAVDGKIFLRVYNTQGEEVGPRATLELVEEADTKNKGDGVNENKDGDIKEGAVVEDNL